MRFAETSSADAQPYVSRGPRPSRTESRPFFQDGASGPEDLDPGDRAVAELLVEHGDQLRRHRPQRVAQAVESVRTVSTASAYASGRECAALTGPTSSRPAGQQRVHVDARSTSPCCRPGARRVGEQLRVAVVRPGARRPRIRLRLAAAPATAASPGARPSGPSAGPGPGRSGRAARLGLLVGLAGGSAGAAGDRLGRGGSLIGGHRRRRRPGTAGPAARRARRRRPRR